MNASNAGLMGLVLAAGLAATGQAGAASRFNDLSALNVSIRCEIVAEKVIEITNTSGGFIAGGTTISYDVVRRPDQAHVVGSFVTSGLGPGSSVKKGLFPALSCTAWFRRPLVLAPVN
jgi:hypothetical protein